jgi:hypothetical protein
MKKLLLAIVLLIFVPQIKAQDVFVGANGGGLYNNYFLNVTAGVELPYAKILETDIRDDFAPLESHTQLGHGWANIGSLEQDGYITKSFGLSGKVEYSSYSTKIVKASDYVFGGIVIRKMAWGAMTKFHFSYVREFNNGISANGTETSHLQGGDFFLQSEMGCSKKFCYRLEADFQAGRVLTQSNPVCDGTYGIIGGPNGGPCYRTPAWGGGASMGFTMVFPRR